MALRNADTQDDEAGLAREAAELLQRLIRLDTVNPPGHERAAQEGLAAAALGRRL